MGMRFLRFDVSICHCCHGVFCSSFGHQCPALRVRQLESFVGFHGEPVMYMFKETCNFLHVFLVESYRI